MRAVRPALLALLVILIALAAGCSKPSAPFAGSTGGPPSESGTAEPTPGDPAPGQGDRRVAHEDPASTASAGGPPCLKPADVGAPPFGRMALHAVAEGLCTAVAAAEEAYLVFEFPPGLAEEDIRSSLEVAGGEVAALNLYEEDRWMLSLRLGPAAPGTETTVRVRGPVGQGGAPADLGFRLLREASPTVAVEVQAGDGPWRPHEPGEFLPPGPARVRATFSHALAAHAADQVRLAFESAPGIRGAPYHISWLDSRTLLVELPEPPPALFVDLRWLEDERGLTTREGVVNLHTGEPPRLVALDPATGREEELGPAPLDILWTTLSPDGRWVAMEALRPSSADEWDVWLVDTAAGRAMKTDLEASPYIPGYYWFPDRLIVAAWEKLQEWDLNRHTLRVLPARASYAGPLSPDGRYLAGRILEGPEDPETWLAPLTVAVYDLATETERLYPRVGNFRVPHRGGGVPISVPMRWADDGRSLYVLQWVEDAPFTESKPYWAVLDLETGVLTAAEDFAADPFTYPPYEPQRVSSASGWAFTRTYWGEITLTTPGGETVTHGEGLPLAWMPDGRLLLVRWPDHAYRRDIGW